METRDIEAMKWGGGELGLTKRELAQRVRKSVDRWFVLPFLIHFGGLRFVLSEEKLLTGSWVRATCQGNAPI